MGEAGFSQSFTQQGNIVGSAAAAPGLEINQSSFVRIIFSGQQGIKELTDNQNGRVTGIVMDIAQSQLSDFGAVIFQKFHVITVGAHEITDQLEVSRQHIRCQNSVIFLHLFSKLNIVFISRCCHF